MRIAISIHGFLFIHIWLLISCDKGIYAVSNLNVATFTMLSRTSGTNNDKMIDKSQCLAYSDLPFNAEHQARNPLVSFLTPLVRPCQGINTLPTTAAKANTLTTELSGPVGLSSLLFEPQSKKFGPQGFHTGTTQTRLYSHRRWLEAGNFGFRK